MVCIAERPEEQKRTDKIPEGDLHGGLLRTYIRKHIHIIES